MEGIVEIAKGTNVRHMEERLVPSMPDFGQMNGESVQGELPIHSNAEQPRTGQTDQRFKITERK